MRSWLNTKTIDEPQMGDRFITNKEMGAYVALSANLSYLAAGDKYRKVRPQEIKTSKQRWPKPLHSCAKGVLSSQTRINQVLDWDRRARSELGTYFDPQFSAHIRSRICSYQDREVLGDDR
jgi:hypothetical protein